MLVWRGHKGKVRSLAFSPDGRFVATAAGESRFAWLWESHTGRPVRKFRGYPGAVRAVAFFPDGGHLAGLHARAVTSVWAVGSGEKVANLYSREAGRDCLAVSSDGSRLVAFDGDDLDEWDEPTRPTEETRWQSRCLEPYATNDLTAFGFSPGGNYFWRAEGPLSLYDSTSTTLVRRLADPDRAGATACGFTSDDSRACVAFGRRAVVWRLDEPDAPPVKLKGHEGRVQAVGFLTGGTVLTAALDGTCRLWDAATGAQLRAFDWGIGRVRAAAVSPDGTLCAAGGDDGHLVVWDVDV